MSSGIQFQSFGPFDQYAPDPVPPRASPDSGGSLQSRPPAGSEAAASSQTLPLSQPLFQIGQQELSPPSSTSTSPKQSPTRNSLLEAHPQPPAPLTDRVIPLVQDSTTPYISIREERPAPFTAIQLSAKPPKKLSVGQKISSWFSSFSPFNRTVETSALQEQLLPTQESAEWTTSESTLPSHPSTSAPLEGRVTFLSSNFSEIGPTEATPLVAPATGVRAVASRVIKKISAFFSHPATQITVGAGCITGAVVSGHCLEEATETAKYAAIAGLGVCSAGAGLCARKLISLSTAANEWYKWGFNATSHAGYLLLQTISWMPYPSVALTAYVAGSVLTGAIVSDLFTTTANKITGEEAAPTPEQRVFQLATAKYAEELSALPPDQRGACMRFLANYWRSILITALAIPPTVALSTPAVIDTIFDACSPLIANSIVYGVGSLANFVVAMPLGFHVANKLYKLNALNSLTPDITNIGTLATKGANFICHQGRGWGVAAGFALMTQATNISPNSFPGAIAIATLGMLSVGFALGSNHAERTRRNLFKEESKVTDIETGERLQRLDPDSASCCFDASNVKTALQKWDNLFGAARFIRQNFFTLTLAPTTAGLIAYYFKDGLAVAANLTIPVALASMPIGALIEGWASHRFSFSKSPSSPLIGRIQGAVRYAIKNWQLENFVSYTVLSSACVYAMPDGQLVALVPIAIAMGLLGGLGIGSAQGHANAGDENIYPMQASIPSATLNNAFAL